MLTTTQTSFSSSSSQLPVNETLPISMPDDTTVTPLVSEIPTTYSSVEVDKIQNTNESTTLSSVPSPSTHASLEGVDYRQSTLFLFP